MSRELRVLLLFRSPRHAVSIEQLFDSLVQFFDERIRVSKWHLDKRICPLIVSILKLRRSTFDLIHITGDVHYFVFLLFPKRVILTIHDLNYYCNLNFGIKKFIYWLIWIYVPVCLAANTNVISEKTRRQVQSCPGLSRRSFKVIPNGTDMHIYRADESPPPNPKHVLHVGTDENKNLRRVLEALLDTPLVIIIIGRITADIENYKKLYGSRMILYEKVSKENLISIYKSSAVLSFPSLSEGFGMPVIEAQALGVPVLTSDREPMTTVASPNSAYFVDPLDVEAIRVGFEKIVSDDSFRMSLIVNGLENALQYHADRCAASYSSLYFLSARK